MKFKMTMLVCFLSLSGIVNTSAQDTPEMVVQKQLEAYNARDLKAFVSTYADSVEICLNNLRKTMQH
jgi:hypothetical protein